MDNPFGREENVREELEITTALDKPDEPKIFDEEKSKELTARELRLKEKSDALAERKKKKQEILDEFGGHESDVPINSDYWDL